MVNGALTGSIDDLPPMCSRFDFINIQPVNPQMLPFVSRGWDRREYQDTESEMVAIVNSTASTATVLLLQSAEGPVFDGTGKSATGTPTAGSSSSTPADVVELSDHAKATIEKARADQAATADLTLSFDEVLAKRTDDLTKTLTEALKG